MRKEDKPNKRSKAAFFRRGILLALLLSAGMLAAQTTLKPNAPPVLPQSATPAPAQPDQRSVREKAYEKDLQMLKELLDEADAEIHAQAAESLQRMIAEHQTELAVEEALVSAGLDPVCVVMHNGAVTVMIAPEKMTEENSASILALCVAHAQVDAQNVRIMNASP